MLNWFRGIKSTEVTVEEKKPSPRKSLFSTHDVDNSSFDTMKSSVTDILSDLKRKQPIFDPKVNVRMANAAMDDSSNGFPEFKMYDAGGNTVSDAVVFWYASQGFIGAQMCGIIAQNWLVNKACAMPADDAIRKGYNIVSVDGEELDPEAVKIMKSVDRSMRLEWNMREFIRKGRIFGVRVAMFKVQSTDPDYYEKPFNIDGVTAGSYKGIVQVDPYWCAPMLDGPSASEPDTLHFYEPTWWIINGKKIHRSHLIIFRHAEPVDVLKPQYIYGGVPLTQQIMERVYAAERTSNEAPQLAMSKRTTVWLTDMEAVMANTQDAVSRLQQWAQYRDNYGVKLGDKEGDEFQQFDTSLADFDALIMTQYQLVAAIAGVPATKLIGTSPKGFGASGEYEEASYHELLESIQAHDLTPLAERHHQLVIKAFVEPQLKVKMSTETTLNWLPLDTPTAQELAATNLAKAQVGQILLNAGAVSSEEERQRVATDKTSGYNEIGLEDNPPPEPPDNDPDGTPPEGEEEDHLNAQDEASFVESKHPRANNGQFGSGVGGTKSPKSESTSHKEAAASKGSSEKNGSPPPKAGEPFVVYRVAEREGLENRNAGNANGVALHVMNQQSSEGARTTGNAPDHIYAYRIIPDSDVDGKYEGATYNGTLKGDKIGRVENKYGIAYSFPEKGYKSELIGKVSLEDLKKQAGNKDFDDLGTNAGSELIRNHFEKQSAQDAEFVESDHPRAKNGQFGSGGHAVSQDPHSQAKTTAPITTPASKEAMANKVPSHLTAKKESPKASGKTAKSRNPFPVGSNKVDIHGHERSPDLNPKERAIETAAFEAIDNHTPELISEYKEKFGNEIDPDKVKELFPEFAKDKSYAAAVHEPSSELSKVIWRNALKEKGDAGDTSPTLFTAGGSGSGKSEAMKVAKSLVGAKDDALTFDSVLGNFKSATDKIQEALDLTKGPVDIIYTNAPIETATFLNLKRDRTVRMKTLMDAHIKASANIKALQEHYKDNPRVRISIINNQGAGLENMVEGKLSDVPTYSIEGMRERILNYATKVVAENKIFNGPKKLKMLLQGEDSA
jgi:hypothetical protein